MAKDLQLNQRGLINRALLGATLALAMVLVSTGCESSGEGGVLSGAFEGLMPPTPGEAARDAFNVYDPDKRRRSVALLSASEFGGEEPYVRMYRLLVDDPDATVRAAAIAALGLHGKPEDVAKINARLIDTTDFVRWESAQALQKLHEPSAVTPLLKALSDDTDADVRAASAYALGQYAEPRVVQALIGALDDLDFSVVTAAQQSLATLTGYDFGHDASLWLIWTEKHQTDLFAHQQKYTWQPFNKPKGWLGHVQFWEDGKRKEPQAPAGIDQAGNS